MSKRLPILLGLILICVAIWLLITPTKFAKALMERLDNLGYDLQLRTRVLTKSAIPESPVAIIDIDDKSLEKEGRWPWPRNKLAELVDKLQSQGATVIAFDIFLSEKETNIADTIIQTLSKKNLLNNNIENALKTTALYFDNDKIFAKSIADTPSVLAIGFLPRAQKQNQLPPPLITLNKQDSNQLSLIKSAGYISNIPIFEQSAHGSGFLNIFPDNDGIIRHAPLVMEYEQGVYPSLALAAVLAFLNEHISLVAPSYNKTKKLEGIKVGERLIPTDENGQVLIPFIGKSYTFPFYSATDILHNKINKDAIAGKILFVGTSATGLGDLHATAIQNPFPGVEIQATLVNGMLLNNFSYKPAWTFGANLVLTLLFGLIAAFLFPHLGPRLLGSIIIILPPTLLFANNWFWEQTGLVLSLLMPVLLVLFIALVNIIYGYLFETRRREQLKEIFGQYVPEKHIEAMLKSSGNYGMYGEDREMSVLFADIRSFATISEGLTASELVDMLNTFFTPMTEIIFKHHGTIDKYVGDLIMAFWGAPLKDKHHARHALESALEMRAKVKEMRPLLAAHNWPEIKIGLGINSGIMSVGDMGSRFRRNYTVLGDAVNLASRVEGITKFYGVSIAVTENTQQNQPDFIFRKLDLVRVKGKKVGIAIYEVICKATDITPTLKAELDLYHQALDDYFKRDWDKALELMEQLHARHPKTKIYRLYIDRINEFKENPLPDDWDGVYVHSSK